MTRSIALSIRNEEMLGNRIFELPSEASGYLSPYTPWSDVRHACRLAGLELITADMVEVNGIDPRDVTLISYDWPPLTDALVTHGARLGVLTSLEPPIIAWELYYRLPRLSARFPHVLLFRGGQTRVSPGTKFHPLDFPQVKRMTPIVDTPRTRFLVSIISNKAMVRSFARWFDRPREVSVKRTLATLRYPPLGRDLYLERLRASAYFGRRSDFDLYGQGWGRRHPAVPPALHAAAIRAYRGTVAEKLETLARYRFCLCFENSQFDGYVSEKIFDCFLAGTVPVYLGAPDIERYVPREAFIDMRRFHDYRELEAFLDALDDSAVTQYREAGQAFLRSEAYAPFTAECFARQIVDMLTDVVESR